MLLTAIETPIVPATKLYVGVGCVPHVRSLTDRRHRKSVLPYLIRNPRLAGEIMTFLQCGEVRQIAALLICPAGPDSEELSVSICSPRFTQQRTWQHKLLTSETAE